MTNLSVTPLAHAGAAIEGLELDEVISEGTRAELNDIWREFGLLVFRGVGTSVQRHINLARCFGTLKIHPIKSKHVEGHPELISVGGEDRGAVYIVNGKPLHGYTYWHQDMAYTPSISKGSMLRMVTPATEGGKTAWTDTMKAYAALPEDMKAKIEGLEMLQRFKINPDRPWGQPSVTLEEPAGQNVCLADFGDFPPVIHPIVVRHPDVGRKTLLVSPLQFDRILGVSDAESDELFDRLTTHCLRDDFTYTHTWAENDMVLWDNRRTMHIALGYPANAYRLAYRVTLEGDFQTGRFAPRGP